MTCARPAARGTAIASRILGLATLFAAACMPARYREDLPDAPRDSTRAESPAGGAAREAGGSAAGATVVGRVTPDGTLIADTLAGPLPDTLRVERETVVTGEIRPPAGEAVYPPAAAEPEAAALTTGWRVQVYASRSRPDAEDAATRLRQALGVGAPVYVERDGEWFKVRAGDFAGRSDAEALRQDLAGRGWPDAWAVQTAIRAQP